MKFATIFRLNHNYGSSQENILTRRLLANMKTHDWSFRQEDFGVLVKKYYLTKRYSTQMPPDTETHPSANATP